jgi:asparagine synthase (glutamine-hydrolysing)
MCGIAGFFRSGFSGTDETLLKRMGDTIRYRGPDAAGTYLDNDIGFVHRRLSIIDLSDAGTQPMTSRCGRYVIVFNGEIYNFLELRSELENRGYKFRTHTDTEVILALYAEKGIRCLDDFNGMFAFALWDKQTRNLFLARDRIGKKPLYYFADGNKRFAFASEIKPLLELPEISPIIDKTAIIDYLKYLYVPAPKSIFYNIFKLKPGHFITLSPGETPQSREYWDVHFDRLTTLDFSGAAEQLHDLISSSTRLRMIADVPLGAFLSGGIDSSGIVALMAQFSKSKVKTCTIGFDDPDHDETPFAGEIAGQFKTDHTEYEVRDNLAETITRLPQYFDEPFADSSAVPTFHVSRLARQKVTVALAGDGGDENFGGYEKYATELIENRVRTIVPRPLLSFVGAMSRGGTIPLFRKANSLAFSALLDPGRAYYITNTFVTDENLRQILSDSIKKQYAGYDPAHFTLQYWNRMRGADHITCMLYTDIKTYLPGDILVKVDRMSMAHSLEVRAPLLDYRIVEFAASLPGSWKINNRDKKYILKKTFSRHLPKGILERKKHGFTVPLDSWFRNELRVLALESIIHNRILGEYFSSAGLQYIWDQHQKSVVNHGTLLWSLLCFSLWHQQYMQGAHV